MADLITAAEYKTLANISSTEMDTKLALIIPMVSDFVKTYCGRQFANNTVTAITEYSSAGGNRIYIKEPPITAITSVSQKSLPASAYTVLTEYVDYEWDFSTDSIVCLDPDGFLSIPNAVKVVYNGGFATIPSDLKLGVVSLVTYYMKNESVPRRSLNSNQVSSEYPQSQDLPPHIKRVLELYRIIY